MKTLNHLEQLIKSYSEISAIDAFKAEECIKTLRLLDNKYRGFGEDYEFNSKEYLQRMCSFEEIESDRQYVEFIPENCAVLTQSAFQMFEITSKDYVMYIPDNIIYIVFEMLADLLEYGELSEDTYWFPSTNNVEIRIHDISSNKRAVMELRYCSDIINLAKSKLNYDLVNRVVYDVDTLELARIFNKMLTAYRLCKNGMFSSNVKYSANIEKVFDSPRYYNALKYSEELDK